MGAPENAEGGRELITWVDGALDVVVDEAEAALAKLPDWPVFFQRGGALVRPVRRGPVSPRRMGATAGGLGMNYVDVPFLVELFTRAATFVKPCRARRGDQSEATVRMMNCPEIVARTYLARAGQWRVPPPLTGVTETPTLRPDRSVLDRPGYDAQTGLFFDPGETVFEPINPNPTRDEGLDALYEFADVLSEFSFESEVDRAVALAAQFGALVQPSFSNLPMVGFTAPTYGSGKTLLADCVALLATGRRSAVMPAPKDAAEFEKAFFAVLAESVGLIVFDNIEHDFLSDALAAALTAETFKGRVLGSTRTICVPTNVAIILTGNNLRVAGDLAARTLLCRLDPQTARPESRSFKRDLHEWIPRHRGRLVARALTFLRAFIVAENKPVLEPWGRFPLWSELIRGALVWGDFPDPLGALRHCQEEDPRMLEHAGLMEAWLKNKGSDWVTVRQLTSAARDAAMAADDLTLKDALLAVCGERDEPNVRKLGRWLSKHAGRIHSGMRIEKGSSVQGVQRWRVRRQDASGAWV